MTTDPACPPWWRERTERFGEVLARPLSIVAGAFRSSPDAQVLTELRVVERAPGAIARLRLYHEQGWKRRFVALQQSFPRTERLLGAHRFNRAAMIVLTHERRAGHDLAEIAEPFFPALAAALAGGGAQAWLRELRTLLSESRAPRLALRAASCLDEAERRAFRADVPAGSNDVRWRERQDARARLAPSFSLLRVEHDLVDVSRVCEGRAQSLRAPLHVTVVATASGVAVRLIDPVFARLLALASERTLGEAVARTRAALDARLVARFDADAYVGEAFGRGYWVGLVG
ncbi:MAG: hypothetical protein ACK6CU_23500 [Deltaproteobacteria bacterium]